MSNGTTKRMIRAYIQDAMPTMFLSGFFVSPAENFHTSEEVEIDIMRDEEDVAIVITDLSTGARINSDDLFTNKKFKPPIYKEEGTLNAFDLISREAGENPFQDPNFQANAIVRSFRVFRKLEKKIRRAIELQSSQIMQSGALTLRDAAGNALYTINFVPKATHFPTAGTTWGQAGATPYEDVKALSEVIRADGLVDPDILIFGADAFDEFLQDPKVVDRFDVRRSNQGELAPEMRGQGGVYQGRVMIGNYMFQLWTYSGRYKNPQTGVSTPFVNPGSVIMLSSSGSRLDLTFGSIPRIVPTESRALPFLPARLPNQQGGMDLTTNAWITPDGESLKVSAGTRPMTFPTAIDSFGCLDSGL